jgi:hypothetical protein
MRGDWKGKIPSVMFRTLVKNIFPRSYLPTGKRIKRCYAEYSQKSGDDLF